MLYCSEMRYIALILVALFAYIAFVPPSGMKTATGQLQKADKLFPWLAERHQPPPADPAGRMTYIEKLSKSGDVRPCAAFDGEASVDKGPSGGDWIAYCLGRVLRDARRCDQITATITPALRTLCAREVTPSAS